jgi:hypothetical protein
MPSDKDDPDRMEQIPEIRSWEELANQETPGATTAPWKIRVGLEVVGSDRESVGQVKEIRQTDFLVHRPLAPDVYVPFEACQAIFHDLVILAIPAGEVDNQAWAQP